MDVVSLHWLWGAVVALGTYIFRRSQKDTDDRFAKLEKRMNTIGGTLLSHAEKHVRHEEGHKHLTEAVNELKACMEKNTEKLTDIHMLLCEMTGRINQKEKDQ